MPIYETVEELRPLSKNALDLLEKMRLEPVRWFERKDIAALQGRVRPNPNDFKILIALAEHGKIEIIKAMVGKQPVWRYKFKSE